MNLARHATTLLVVDDDPSMVRLLSNVIERGLGDQVTIESFSDPLAALRRIEEGGVDLLLTDLEMPGVSGLEMLKSAKQRNAATQVLLLTGRSSQDALLEAMELGATDYILKPVDRELLLELLDQAHGRQKRWRLALAETWKQRAMSTASTK